MIRLNHPQLPTMEQLMPYLREIDGSGHYTNHGPLVQRLEQQMRHELGAPCVAVANATLGLELAIQAHGLRRKRILIPALTFRATATAIKRTGNYMVLGDVNEETWQLTPEIADRYRGRFDAVIPVAAYGRPLDAAAWERFALSHDVPVIMDTAASFGSQEIRTTCVFSLHATKALAAAEGGIVASHDEEILQRIRQLSQFEEEAATNAKLSEYHAAIALAMLDQWPDIAELRRSLRREYIRTFNGFSYRLQDWPRNAVPTLMVIRLPGHDGREIVHQLRECGIESKRWYCPTVDEWMNLSSAGLVGTKRIRGELVGLPFHVRLTSEEIQKVVETLGNLL